MTSAAVIVIIAIALILLAAANAAAGLRITLLSKRIALLEHAIFDRTEP